MLRARGRRASGRSVGVLAPEPGLTMDDLDDWEVMVAALAAQTPVWEPGAAYGYHAHTFGWLVGELVRRVDGRGLGRFFAEEIAGPAGTDFWIGLPESEEDRLAPIVTPEQATPEGIDPSFDLSAFIGPYLMTASSLNGILPQLGDAALDRRYRAAELGGAGGVASGRGLSCLYAWLLEAFTPATIADILVAETEGPDLVLSAPAMPAEQKIGRGFMVSPRGGAGRCPDVWPRGCRWVLSLRRYRAPCGVRLRQDPLASRSGRRPACNATRHRGVRLARVTWVSSCTSQGSPGENSDRPYGEA